MSLKRNKNLNPLLMSREFVDTCVLIGIPELAARLNRAVATIRTQVTRQPEKLPPRFFIPGSSQVAWLLSDVLAWMVAGRDIQVTNPPIKDPAKRRGAPSSKEKIAATNAGLSIHEFRTRSADGRV